MSVVSVIKDNILIIAILVIVAIIGIAIAYYFTTRSNKDNDNNDPFDDSDVPIPPSTLEYNRSLSPTRRNNDLTGASGVKAVKPALCKDYKGDPYYPIIEDIYTL